MLRRVCGFLVMAILVGSTGCARSGDSASLSPGPPTTATTIPRNFYNTTYPILDQLIGVAHQEVARPVILGQGQDAVIAACRRGLELLAEARADPKPASRTGQVYLAEAFEHYQQGFEQHCIQRFSSLPLQEELGSAAGLSLNVMANERRREQEGR